MAKRQRILVTGAKGMLGTDLVARLKRARKYDLVPVDIEEMDITRLGEVKSVLLDSRPEVVIHCAAYTAVDRAEKEPEMAMAVNAEGTKNLAFFCREVSAEMIYLSTDYVFDGRKRTPYVETDEPNPINMYGKSKLAGESHIVDLLDAFKIVRTSWLCGVHGPNFIDSIIQAVEGGKKTISVVNDQMGKPTFTFDLADVVVKMVGRPEKGIFHATNSGYCSWYEFAQRIVKLSKAKNVKVRPITSEQFRSLAKRPKYSLLENARLQDMRFRPLPRWEDSLKEYMQRREEWLAKEKEKPEALKKAGKGD